MRQQPELQPQLKVQLLLMLLQREQLLIRQMLPVQLKQNLKMDH